MPEHPEYTKGWNDGWNAANQYMPDPHWDTACRHCGLAKCEHVGGHRAAACSYSMVGDRAAALNTTQETGER